ncbi:MAG: metal-sensing transcriptional repressor [Patescibacteria group bacterium]
MLEPSRKKTLDAIRRIEGLTKKLRGSVEAGVYCPQILELVLAIQGHIDYIQATVLESHLKTCAPRELASKRHKDKFVAELLRVIGLSKR